MRPTGIHFFGRRMRTSRSVCRRAQTSVHLRRLVRVRADVCARCQVEKSLLWKITGSLAAAGNDLRVGKQLLFSKPKIIVKQTVFNMPTLKTRGLLVVSNAEKAYKPRWYLPLAQIPRCVTFQVAQMLLGYLHLQLSKG